MKLINRGWAKPGDEIAQPVGIVLGGNLRQNTEPKIKQPSPMQLEERSRPRLSGLTSSINFAASGERSVNSV
jgi:hypothetical protein